MSEEAGCFDSSSYWESRYASGGNSGAGSYGDCLEHKKNVLATILHKHGICTIADFGCGDGTVIGLFPQLGLLSYTGYDVSSTALDRLRSQGWPSNYSFKHMQQHRKEEGADLALSLDVFFHLVDDQVAQGYLDTLFCGAYTRVLLLSWNASIVGTTHTVGNHVRYRDVLEHAAAYPDYIMEYMLPYQLGTSTYYMFKKVG